MKELLMKFESEEDYNGFMDIIVKPGLNKDCEFDESTNTVLVKNLNKTEKQEVNENQ